MLHARQQRGAWAEQQAERFLRQSGLITVAKNFRVNYGEIDLIMKDQDFLVFVEVRYRKDRDFGGAEASISCAKRNRLVRAAQIYLQRQRLLDKIPCRFDVVAIAAQGSINWIRQAFTLE